MSLIMLLRKIADLPYDVRLRILSFTDMDTKRSAGLLPGRIPQSHITALIKLYKPQKQVGTIGSVELKLRDGADPMIPDLYIISRSDTVYVVYYFNTTMETSSVYIFDDDERLFKEIKAFRIN